MEVDTVRNGYFNSYEDLEIHRLMLEDASRTEAYMKAILGNKSYFKDKVVMDVGCGTGILSIFCAQAGAKKVYAVEASHITELAEEIIKNNKFEHVIEVIHSKVEDLILPDIKVDAIVSEWMGFYLLHEGMLESVLMARDKFLKQDGYMFPDSAAIYIAPCSVPSLYSKWENLYGVCMSTFAKYLRKDKYSKPEIISIKNEDLLANPEVFCWINLKDDQLSDLKSFSIQHVVGASRSGSYQGLCLWFDCMFPTSEDEGQLILSTGPVHAPTHWKQTVILLPEEQQIEEDEPIAFKLDMNKDPVNGRRYNLELSLLDPDTVEHPLPCSCHMTKCILIKTFMLQNAPLGDTDGVEDDDSSLSEG